MADDLRAELLQREVERLRRPRSQSASWGPAHPPLPPSPHPTLAPEIPGYTLTEAYGRLRQMRPELARAIRRVEYGPTRRDNFRAAVSSAAPSTVVIDERHDPAVAFPEEPQFLDPITAVRLLAHEGQHAADLTPGSGNEFGTEWWHEDRAFRTEDDVLKQALAELLGRKK